MGYALEVLWRRRRLKTRPTHRNARFDTVLEAHRVYHHGSTPSTYGSWIPPRETYRYAVRCCEVYSVPLAYTERVILSLAVSGDAPAVPEESDARLVNQIVHSNLGHRNDGGPAYWSQPNHNQG